MVNTICIKKVYDMVYHDNHARLEQPEFPKHSHSLVHQISMKKKIQKNKLINKLMIHFLWTLYF